MQVLSVNVGLPKEIEIDGGMVASGIWKTPVKGQVSVRTVNLDGDRQADLSVHGGPDKAVYIYPSEHYPFWEEVFRQRLPWGALGENLTIEGISENTINVGDRLRIGSATLQVTQPRLPCFKLAAKFQDNGIIKRFLGSRRTGWYARVLQEGLLQAGDRIVVIERHPAQLTIREVTDIFLTKHPERTGVERVLSVGALSEAWRRHFQSLL